MSEGELWEPRAQRVKEVHIWRPRRSRFGELVQWDTREHDWLEGRGPKLYLIAMIDDATSRALAEFVLQVDGIEYGGAGERAAAVWADVVVLYG